MQQEIEKRYTFIENPIQDSKQREAYFALAKKIFWLDFSIWYTSGYWSDKFIPYTLFDGDKAVSSVGIVIHHMKWKGETRCFVQLSTVMTDPEYRGQELGRYLMEKVLETWQNQCDVLYLYANDSVTSFYPKFGFEEEREYTYSRPLRYTDTPLRKLDLASARDVELLAQKYKSSNPFSALTMENHFGILMFHCLMSHKENIYYSEEHDAVIIASVEGETLFCYDIFTESNCGLEQILGSFGAGEVTSVTLGFMPKSAEGYHITTACEEDTTLFILKDKEHMWKENKITLPLLSRA